jgi:hypothetical protein
MIEKKFEKFGKSVAVYHGLGGGGGKLIPRLLRKYGFTKIHYPEIDYETQWYRDKCKSLFNRELRAVQNVDLIIGFSLGGYTAFELAGHTSKNLMLVNPAIDRSKTLLDIKWYDIPVKRDFGKIEVYLGTEDTLIDKQWTIDYLKKLNIKSNIFLVNGMEHNTYIEEFEQMLDNSKLKS